VKTGCMGSNGVVGEGMRLAVGTAFAQKYNKTDNVTAVFFGEGASGPARSMNHSTWPRP